MKFLKTEQIVALEWEVTFRLTLLRDLTTQCASYLVAIRGRSFEEIVKRQYKYLLRSGMPASQVKELRWLTQVSSEAGLIELEHQCRRFREAVWARTMKCVIDEPLPLEYGAELIAVLQEKLDDTSMAWLMEDVEMSKVSSSTPSAVIKAGLRRTDRNRNAAERLSRMNDRIYKKLFPEFKRLKKLSDRLRPISQARRKTKRTVVARRRREAAAQKKQAITANRSGNFFQLTFAAQAIVTT